MARDTDRAEALSKRLHQVGDRQLMNAVLGTALEQMMREPVQVDDYEIRYCKVKPWPDINLALQLHGRAGSGAFRHHVSCTIRPKASSALEQFQNEVSRLTHRRIGLPDAPQQLPACPIAIVPEMSMLVRLFPFDLILTGLDFATDVPRMLALFRRHLPCPEDACCPSAVRYEVVHYKPERLCTLRYTVQMADSTRQSARSCDVFGKVYRDDRWKSCSELQTVIWRAACASDGVWRCARPVVSVPEERLVLQEAVAGRPFSRRFVELTHENASETELTQAERHLKAVASALRSMQCAPVRVRRSVSFRGLLAHQGRNLPYLRRSHPQLATELVRLRAELARLGGTSSSQPMCFSHGDFAYGNVLLDNEAVGIIDFDKGSQAEPAYDAAYFLTHLSSFGIRHPKRLRHVTRLCEAFRHAYLSLARDVNPRRLALYEALDLTAYVMRNFRKQSHQPNWLPWAHAQTDTAWQRLSCAGPQARCMS